MSPRVLFPLVGLLLIALGYPMSARRVRPNRWYGLRVPATFADETVWYDANAVAGRDAMGLGALVTAIALVLPLMVDLPPEIFDNLRRGSGHRILAPGGARLAHRQPVIS
jgi:uncharacterized membrane protein